MLADMLMPGLMLHEAILLLRAWVGDSLACISLGGETPRSQYVPLPPPMECCGREEGEKLNNYTNSILSMLLMQHQSMGKLILFMKGICIWTGLMTPGNTALVVS